MGFLERKNQNYQSKSKDSIDIHKSFRKKASKENEYYYTYIEYRFHSSSSNKIIDANHAKD